MSDSIKRIDQSNLHLYDMYVAETWIEENPECPIHNKPLEVKNYVLNNGVSEHNIVLGYCSQCKQFLVRNSKASHILAEAPTLKPHFHELIKKKQVEKIRDTNLKPYYRVTKGIRSIYNIPTSALFLTHNDVLAMVDEMRCSIDAHDVFETKLVVSLKGKSTTRGQYLFNGGYCKECDKYFILVDDYKAIEQDGVLEVKLENLTKDSGKITFGEEFDLEYDRVIDIYKSFKKAMQNIYDQPDYVDPYATASSYEEIADLQWRKDQSSRKYGSILERYASYGQFPSPYRYRVDVKFGTFAKETIYIGPKDIIVEEEKKVISYDSPEGRELVNTKNAEALWKGRLCTIYLQRDLTIEDQVLQYYQDLVTFEDRLLNNGITDDFLVRVLKMRKNQKGLVDIIATIQEKQTEIVDLDSKHNLIVQGCAGSGKTMVMLHRLSKLQYDSPNGNLDVALILTPNEQFNLHINGVVETMRLSDIKRQSVEGYYIELLKKYSEDFRVPKEINLIKPEREVNEEFLKYLYSEDYQMDLGIAYSEVIDKQNEEYKSLKPFIKDMVGDSGYSFNSQNELISDLNAKYHRIKARLDITYAEVKKCEEELEKLRKEYEEQIVKQEELKGTSANELNQLIELACDYLKEDSSKVNVNSIEDEEIRKLQQEEQRVKTAFFMLRRNERIEEIHKLIEDLLIQKEDRLKKENKYSILLEKHKTLNDIDSKYDWVVEVSDIYPDIADKLKVMNENSNQWNQINKSLDALNTKIKKATRKLDEAKEKDYSEDIKNEFRKLEAFVKDNTLMRVYQKVFVESTKKIRSELKVKIPKGIHRYDLFIELMFAINYFGKYVCEEKMIFIDEGQDLSFMEYSMLYEMHDRKTIFNIFGDVNQMMKPGRGIEEWRILADVFEAKIYELNENYRNTNQITDFCNKSFGFNTLKTGVDGLPVREIWSGTLENDISKNYKPNRRIALLLPRNLDKKNYLKKSLLDGSIKDLISNELDSEKISVLYVDEAKGIEFDKVYVVTSHLSKNEKYIALTRALSELIIVIDENVPDEIFIEKDSKEENSEKES